MKTKAILTAPLSAIALTGCANNNDTKQAKVSVMISLEDFNPRTMWEI